MGVIQWLRGVRDLFVGERERAVSVVGSRAYVEYRGIAPERLAFFLEVLEERAKAFPHVASVSLEPYTRRVVLRFTEHMPLVEDLAGLVADAEDEVGTQADRAGVGERVLPDDARLELEYSVEAVADAAALLVGAGLRVVPFFPRRLGKNVYALVFLATHVDAVRAQLEQRFGPERTELGLALANAAAQALAQRPLSSLVDLSARVVSLRELRARRALWERWAPQLTHHEPGLTPTPPLPRPRELPKGPVEKHLDRTWVVALSTFGVSLITSRSPSRAVAAAFSALPQPARLGRELYASELGRVLARHGMLVLSPPALRRLDRVDCLVLPAELVSREQFEVSDVFALRGMSRSQALLIARRMFASDRPLRVQHDGEYTLGPVRLLPHAPDAELEVAMAEHTHRGDLVLALSTREHVVGLVQVQISPQNGVLEALETARKAGMHIVLASDDVGSAEALHPDEVIGYHRGLADGIRRLQVEGRVVCFVGRGPSDGHGAADLSVALCMRERATPWGAHVLCPDDPRHIEILVDACTTARSVSEQSVRMSMGAAALGTLVSTGGFAGRRVMFVVNAASIAAMLNAARRSAALESTRHRHVDPTPWHALDARGVLARLGTTEDGLPDRALEAPRQALFDASSIGEFFSAVRSELMSPLSPLLAAGAGISAMVGSKADAGIVASVGGINALIGGYQRWKTERAITSLIEVAETRARVRRSGRVRELPASELLRGDIVLLEQGDLVPADCRILEASSLEVDNSALTGESLPVLKSPAPSFAESTADITSMLFAGTTIAAGRATAVVVATGEDTVAQRGVSATHDEARGGVEGRLRELMRLTGPVALGAGAALVTAGMLRGRRMDDLVSTGVGLAVAAVPEGLPVLATAAQLAAAERLSRHGSLVKNARAIEALGRVDVLCMDKTGTLTEGRIDLGCVFDGAHTDDAPAFGAPRREVIRVALRSLAREHGVSVDPLDSAIVSCARDVLGAEHEAGVVKVAVRAFESGRSFEAVLLDTPEGHRMAVKGAPEQVFTRVVDAIIDGERWPIAKARERYRDELESMAARGLRVIAIAERAVDARELEGASPDAILSDPEQLTLRGLIAFHDPVRPSAKAGVEGLARAGVRTVMITGDHPTTAATIAREVGLDTPGQVLHGTQLAQMTEAQLENAAEHISVFARVTPAQKVRVVRALQRAGHVVGMVGDGANDAPAMRIADAGIAVGKHCTEAARAAADIVLADARIDNLVEAVVEGRAMWTAVRDAVSILVGGNLGEIAFTVAVGGLTGRPPLSPRQLLLVNFLTDIAPSMAIALRPPSPGDLSMLRHTGPEAALGAPLDREIISRAITTGFGAGGAWLIGRVSGGSTRARTIGLVGLVGSQLGQTLRSGGHSRSVLWTSVGSLAALGVIVQTPGLSHMFGCTPLGPVGWVTALGAAGGATLLSPAVDAVVDRVADLLHAARREPQHPPVPTVLPPRLEPHALPISPLSLRLLRN